MFFLGIALLLALAFVLLLPTIKLQFPKKSGVFPSLVLNYQVLDKADESDLLDITVSHRDGEQYTLVYQNEQLYVDKNGVLALVDEALSKKILSTATVMAVEDTVSEDAEEIRTHLSDMGLEPPEITVKVRYHSGREDVLQIGGSVPQTTYYYYRWSGADAVYMCDEGTQEVFSYSSSLLYPVDQPILHKNLIDHMTLRIQGQEVIELQFSTDSEGVVGAAMQAPYSYPVDATAAQNLVTAAANFRLGATQEEITPENSAEYGFDDPLAVIDIHQQSGVYGSVSEAGTYATYETEEQALRIVLGRKEGDYFYTCAYGGKCYYVSTFLVAALVPKSPDTLATQNPADLGNATITRIQVQLGGSMLDFRQQRVERVLPNNQLDIDEDGNTVYDITATRNGEPISVEAFDTFVTRLKSMKVAGDIDADFSVGAATPRWQLTLTTVGGTTRTIAAYPMDAFFDAVAVNGTVKHALQAESLEVALAELMGE